MANTRRELKKEAFWLERQDGLAPWAGKMRGLDKRGSESLYV
jgi:hypothetical protein